MKVILLAPTPPPIGGIAIWTMRMLNAKLKNNWTVDVVDEKVIGKREVYGDNVKRKLGDKGSSFLHSCFYHIYHQRDSLRFNYKVKETRIHCSF